MSLFMIKESEEQSGWKTKAMLTLLLRQANRINRVLEDLRENLLMLNKITTSNVMLNQLLRS